MKSISSAFRRAAFLVKNMLLLIVAVPVLAIVSVLAFFLPPSDDFHG